MSVIRLLFFVSLPYVVSNDLCLHCPASEVGCGTIVECGPHEACYKDSIVQPNGIIVHEMGCRDKLQCGMSNSFLVVGRDVGNTNPEPKRTTHAAVMCSQCCHGNLCNDDLCGHKVFLDNGGPICYTCEAQLRDNSCSKVTQCSRDQYCQLKPKMFSSDQYVYETKCSSTTICAEEVTTARYYYDGCSAKCCNLDLCNADIVDEGPCRPQLASTHAITPCSSNPCVHGDCYAGPRDYICSCQTGYQGKNCDQTPAVTPITPQVAQPCASSPCVHGMCYDTATNYLCECDRNYTGVNCDTAITPCSSNPCVHGDCYAGPRDYICSCKTGYQGINCDQTTLPTTTTPHPHSTGVQATTTAPLVSSTTAPHVSTTIAPHVSTTTATHVSSACPDDALFCCDFETTCNMQSVQSGQLDPRKLLPNNLWITKTTGNDHTIGRNGHYAELRSSIAVLVSRSINVHGECCVQFAYKICATQHAELTVGIYQTEPNGHYQECEVGGHRQTIIPDNQWHEYAYTVKGHLEGDIKLFFRGLVNTGECSSVAIDDIKVTSGKCACAEHHGSCEHQEAHCDDAHHGSHGK
ncbi:delta-like protein B isoform X2 [Dreissena polymorpha]|uniref:delta-like protein B isoform X2 n=1 Tax=Dreissena polymorpha TaxID=45954 RepID=UPI00226506FC|nr:delta-like protein B isoform X2 [Dreissena polymorpha]